MGEALPRIIIASSGTSIARNSGDPKILEELELQGAQGWGSTAGLRAALERKMLSSPALAGYTRRRDWGKICAELNTLVRLNIDQARDEIVFLATETASGRFCAEAVCRVAREHLGWNVTCHVIEGLQVKDSARFEGLGIRSYIEKILSLYEESKHRREVVLIPTGGFKGVVPYTSLLGMIYKIKTYYIFEDSVTLLELPWLPVDFDYELLDQVKDKLSAIERDTSVPAGDFWAGIPYHERQRYKPLVWEERDMVSLSGIGLLLWDRYKLDYPPELMRDETPPQEKKIKLADTHHGNEKLKKLARRLVNSPYVRKIINSEDFHPYERKPTEVRDGGHLAIILTETDRGYCLVAQTTGRNLRETEKIAELIQSKYKL